MKQRTSEILAKLIRNVKVLRKLKFNLDTRPWAGACPGRICRISVSISGSILGEGGPGRFLVDVRHLPTADPTVVALAEEEDALPAVHSPTMDERGRNTNREL